MSNELIFILGLIGAVVSFFLALVAAIAAGIVK